MGAYKLNIGDANHYLKWTGLKLEIKGDMLAGTISGTRFNVGKGTDEDIYFEDSGVRMYDYEAGGGVGTKGVAFKYSTDIFFGLYWHPTSHIGEIKIGAGSERLLLTSLADSNYGLITNTYGGSTMRLFMYPSGGHDFKLYGSGQIELPNLGTLPTENLAEGQLCMLGGELYKYRSGEWSPV
ncbi:hypothetical protein ES702_06346 [subsurface metagenome]